MKKQLIKRTLCAALALAMAASVASCGEKPGSALPSGGSTSSPATASNFNATGLPIVNEPVEFTIFYAPSSGLPSRAMQDKEFMKKAEKETNVKINWIEVPNSAAAEKISITMNSGSLPDAILGTAIKSILADSIAAEQVVAIDDLLQYTPNTKKLIETYPEVKNAMTYTGDGKMYFFPGASQENFSRVGNPMFINKKWLDALNLEMPKTIDDLAKVFDAFKTKDPNGNGIADEIPMGMCKAWFGLEIYRMYPLWEMQPPIMSPIDASIRGGKLEYNPVTENFKDFLKFMSECYAKGYMESESLTQDNNTLKAKASEAPGKYGFFFAWSPDMVVGQELMKDYELLLPVTSPYGRTMFNCTKDTKPVQVQHGLTILSSCEQPEVLARWYDYFMNGTNSIELYAGEENVGWVKDDAAKTWRVNDEKLKELGVNFDEYRADYAIQTTIGCVIPSIVGYERTNPEGSLAMNKESWSKAYDPFAMSLDEMWPYTTPIDLASEKAQDIALLHTDLKNYIDTFSADIIIKGYTDAKWDEHIKNLDKYKYKEVLEFYQEMYDKYKY